MSQSKLRQHRIPILGKQYIFLFCKYLYKKQAHNFRDLENQHLSLGFQFEAMIRNTLINLWLIFQWGFLFKKKS